MNPLHRTLLAVGLVLTSTAPFSVAHAMTWDAAADFPDVTHANPNGVWTYGYDSAASAGYELTLFSKYTDAGVGIPFFSDASYSSFNTPNFKKNENSVASGGIPAGMLSLHPGPTSNGDDVILRFTAPGTDKYDVNAQFLVGDRGETQAWVILNGNRAAPLATLGVTSVNPSFTVTAYHLNAGDTLDFVVGNYGAYFSDDTPLAVVVTSSVPEPGIFGLLLAGMGVIAGLTRRRPKGDSV